MSTHFLVNMPTSEIHVPTCGLHLASIQAQHTSKSCFCMLHPIRSLETSRNSAKTSENQLKTSENGPKT